MKPTLRGTVFSRFRTISEFADKCGWSRNKAARIVNSVQEPTPDEMETMATVLNLTKEEFLIIFFASLSTKWTA